MTDNPVFRKELLMRLRIRQPAPVRVGIGLAILTLLGVLYFPMLWWLLRDSGAETGKDAWAILAGVQYLLICLIAPSITANAITQEKEQQTWEMLIFTRLLPGEIIFGKLLARMVAVLILLLVFLPLMLFCLGHSMIFGNGSSTLSIGHFLGVYVVMGISALFFATSGLFMSWLTKRTLSALILAHTFVIGGLVIATALVTNVIASLFNSTDIFEQCPLMWINPIMICQEALAPDMRHETTMYLVFGLLIYALLTALMLFLMIAGFRALRPTSQ